MATDDVLRPAQVFGLRVREARLRLGWTQQELATRLTELGRPTDRATVARTEKGKTLAGLDFVIAVAVALRMQPVYLLVPMEDEAQVQLTPATVAAAPNVREWIRGAAHLPGTDVLDVWPHLPESEKRRLVEAEGLITTGGMETDQTAIVATRWSRADAISARIAERDKAADDRKEEQ